MSQKSLILYTSTDNSRRKLKAACQILFTLTPADPSFSPNTYAPIAWQVLSFTPNVDSQQTIKWDDDAYGFTIIASNEDNIVSAGHVSVTVELKKKAILQQEGQDASWEDSLIELDRSRRTIGAANLTGVPKHLALCAVDVSTFGEATYIPVVNIGKIKPHTAIECGPPIMLQAYTVSGYKRGQILKAEDMSRVLFCDLAGRPAPINIQRLEEGQAYQVYSNPGGKVIIDRS